MSFLVALLGMIAVSVVVAGLPTYVVVSRWAARPRSRPRDGGRRTSIP